MNMRIKCVLLFALPMVSSAISVMIVPSAVSPVPLGTVVAFRASADGTDPANLTYRFRTRRVGLQTARRGAEGYRTVIDYGPKPSFEWTTIEGEGRYEIEASVLDRATGEIGSGVIPFEFSRLAGTSPVVTPTRHPLVFIYSAPPCPEGARMRVQFETAGVSGSETPYKGCDGRTTMNFYLAGMRAAAEYEARHAIELSGITFPGAAVSFVTGLVSLATPLAVPISTPVPGYSGILLQSVINANPIATDLAGNLLWYGPSGLSLLTRMRHGGTFIGISEDGSKDPSYQTFREFDLAGITVAETNAERVCDQLVAKGLRPITSFHHEAIHLPDGRFLVLAGSEQIMHGVQGQESIDLLGDTIIVLDRNLQVVWVWDSFDHLDPNRAAVLGETCNYPASLACSAFYQAATGNDWLHGNSLQLTPDGNILYSVRHQDWVVKIDYRNGAGTGQLLWRLGLGGDFQMLDGDDSLWFSHQHDAQLMPDGVSLLLFDNGNTRISRNSGQGTSRGQLWRIDEAARTAKLLLDADLGVNSSALGSAQLLPNGNYHFGAGFLPDPANSAKRITHALEVDSNGSIVWCIEIAAQQYRSFRLQDLYTPPLQ
jgi:arylsulfate sulfotransferase